MSGKNKGISLVSLIIIVVSIIILISIVVNVGYNYIEESNKTETTAVLKLISDAANNRQNDKHVEANTYYVGYPMKSDSISNISGLPEDFTVKSEDLWYFIDAKSADELGVRETEKYIESDLKNPTSDVVKIVLVDYVTGDAYLVEINATLLDGTIESTTCNESPDGNHAYSIQTCTKGSKCIYCGTPQTGHENALGHNFLPSTCTSAGICSRCGAINSNDPAKGHSFATNDITGEEIWTTDATRHWKECVRCGTKKETEEHQKGYVRIKVSETPTVYDAKYHREVCSVCGWESVKTLHKIAYEVTGEYSHRRYCTLCEYSEEHIDTGWITDPTHHWRECDEKCESSDGKIDCAEDGKIFKEEHIDENDDKVCDVCSKLLDVTPPNPFDAVGSYAKVTQVTTSTIEVIAYTTDDTGGTGIKGYYFGIDQNDGKGIIWSELVETGDNAGTKKYINLIHNTAYNVYVKAIDNCENENEAYKIPNTVTAKVPNVKGINGIPDGYYVKESFKIEFQPLDTTLPNLMIEYSIDGGKTWIDETTELIIKDETVELMARVKDTRQPEPNKGDSWGPLTITALDQTPPQVSIAPKAGDTPTILSTSHTAVVTLQDEKAGIASKTAIQYAWSLSNTEKPTTFNTIATTNTGTVNSTTVEIITPEGAIGDYYLWINSGVKDAVGNETQDAICSLDKYNIDDQDVTISNIRMYNETPVIEGKTGYVKKGGTVTLTFTASKALKGAPKVTIGGVTVSDVTSTDSTNWKAIITVGNEMPEGKLSLAIESIVTLAGKNSVNTYDEDDLVEGPVIYDDTLPTMENVNK